MENMFQGLKFMHISLITFLKMRVLLKIFSKFLPINDNDNHPIKVIKITAINISSPGMLYGK